MGAAGIVDAMVAALILLLSVTLAPPFGEASANAVATSGNLLTLEVTVEVEQGTDIVLLQPYGPDGLPLLPVAMSPLGDGAWGTITDIPRLAEMKLGFEIVQGDEKVRSAVHSLIELGVNPAVFQDVTDAAEEEEPAPWRRWGWVALATGAAALVLVLAWALLDSPRRRNAGDDEGDDEVEGPAVAVTEEADAG